MTSSTVVRIHWPIARRPARQTGPLLGSNFTIRVHALWPKKLDPKLQGFGPLTAGTIAEIHRTLAQALPAS